MDKFYIYIELFVVRSILSEQPTHSALYPKFSKC